VDAEVDAVEVTFLVDLIEGGLNVGATKRGAHDHDRCAVLRTPSRCVLVPDCTDVLKQLLP
jgi:hypothetical protein